MSHPAVQAAARLRHALEGSATALAAGHLDALLSGQAALQDASVGLPPRADLSADDRAAIRAELDAARRALDRCRHLGHSLTTFVRISLDAQGRAFGYDPQRIAAAALGGRDLNMRA
jgi:hypothetical protein